MLKKNDIQNIEYEIEEESNMTLAEQMMAAQKRRRLGRQGNCTLYKNADFITGSAAEVERLWSICKYISILLHKRLTLILFEAFLFLKINPEYWDIQTVQLAYADVLSADQKKRLKE